ncbi:MAG: secretin N-terminal domain-containing protein [Sedimentisphaerales bacterium]|nr:secretin N-terminal domain-containing protein [Sedimentisphaerales bacterium]
MVRTRFFGRSTRVTTQVAAAALLLLIAALCIAQDANQTKVTYDEHDQPVVVRVPAEVNQIAPAAEADTAAAITEPAQAVTSVAVVMSGKNEPNVGGSETGVLTPLEQRLRKTVSVEFRETPIADVVRQLGAQANVDILLSPKVVGNVTATLTDIPLDEALNNILAVQGATYISGKNMIRVVPLGDVTMEQAKMVTRVYRIMYADVKDVAAALEKYISKSGQISFAVGTSNIIVTDTEDKIRSIDTFLKEVDRVTPQVLVEAKIYDISCDDTLDLGIDWSAGTDTVYSSTTLGSSKTGAKQPFATGTVTRNTTNFTGQGADNIRFGVLNDSVNIDAIIKANQKDVSAKLLANPRVLVLDNEKAIIKIVQEVPYQELSQTSGGGNIGTTQFKDVGVELAVIPHITGDGLIRMKLKPSFSTTGKSYPIAVPGTDQVSEVPAIDKRETDTIALVKDGETVVLGGLRKREIRKEISKVPLLGDIPVVGLLFRFQGEQKVNSELVVFVTPHIKSQQILPILSERESDLLKQTETKIPKTNQEMLLNKLKRD